MAGFRGFQLMENNVATCFFGSLQIRSSASRRSLPAGEFFPGAWKRGDPGGSQMIFPFGNKIYEINFQFVYLGICAFFCVKIWRVDHCQSLGIAFWRKKMNFAIIDGIFFHIWSPSTTWNPKPGSSWWLQSLNGGEKWTIFETTTPRIQTFHPPRPKAIILLST